MAFSIIMLACLIVCVGIDYLSLKRIDQNGALLGVNCRRTPPPCQVQSIVQQYLRWLRIICLLCAAGGVGLFSCPIRCSGSWSGLFLFRKSGSAVSALSVGKSHPQRLRMPRLPAARRCPMEIRSVLLCSDDTRASVLSASAGTTANLATLRACCGGQCRAIAAILLTGPVLASSTTRPQGWNCGITTVELQSYHGKTGVHHPLDSITKVQVYSSLPEAAGSAASTWSTTGRAPSSWYDGTVHLCLDPTAGKFLRVETEDGIFWLTAETDEQTEKVADWLTEELS
ncbi:MAG: hypothetical protein ACLUIR_05095 [Faecalibacterium prausnitzii]